MNIGEGPILQDQRFRFIIILGLIISAVLSIVGLREMALGTLTGTAFGILNYWLMFDAIKKGKELSSKEANKLFMVRYLLRMVISVAALLLGMQVGVYFVLGVLVGLFLHLITYFSEVCKLMSISKK